MMAPKSSDSPALSKEEYDAFFNRVDLAFAKHQSLVRSWIYSPENPPPPQKTEEELDAEDAALLAGRPTRYGQKSATRAKLPARFPTGNSEHGITSIRSRLLPAKEQRASKARDAEEKAASAKRAIRHESSDDEEGRSSLGKAKKRKRKSAAQEPVEKVTSVEEDPTSGLGTSHMLGLGTAQYFGKGNILDRDGEERRLSLRNGTKPKTNPIIEELVEIKSMKEAEDIQLDRNGVLPENENIDDELKDSKGDMKDTEAGTVDIGLRGKELRRLKKKEKKQRKKKQKLEARGLDSES